MSMNVNVGTSFREKEATNMKEEGMNVIGAEKGTKLIPFLHVTQVLFKHSL